MQPMTITNTVGNTFFVYFDNEKKAVYLDVINNSVERNARLTYQWNGFTYLGFDKKGYSYELTQKEYDYLEQAKESLT